jgi:hypothetical protein
MAKSIKDIPDGRVGQVVQDFIDNGESVVLVNQQGAGGYTVTPSETEVAAALTKLGVFTTKGKASRKKRPPGN